MDGGTFGNVLVKPVYYSDSKCVICSKRASGVHYGVVACEGCKAFYRRTVGNDGQLKTRYQCYVGGECEVGPDARGRCRACRMKKCQQMGMKFDSSKKGRIALKSRQVRGPPSEPSLIPKPEPCQNPSNLTDEEVTADSNTSMRVSVITGNGKNSRKPLLQNMWYVPENIFPVFVSRSRAHNVSLDTLSTDLASKESTQRLLFSTKDLTPDSTITKLANAVNMVYGEQFADWDSFMRDVLENGHTPFQPQISQQAMRENILGAISDTVSKHCALGFHMPGFEEFDQEDQQTLLKERWSSSWLINRYRYVRGNNSYYLAGPARVHYSIYWMAQFSEPEFIRTVFKYSQDLHALQLSQVEAFLLLAITMFSPDTTAAKNKAAAAVLQQHYLECLSQSLRTRKYENALNAEQFQEKISVFLKQFRNCEYLGKWYIRSLDLNQTPFRPIASEKV